MTKSATSPAPEPVDFHTVLEAVEAVKERAGDFVSATATLAKSRKRLELAEGQVNDAGVSLEAATKKLASVGRSSNKALTDAISILEQRNEDNAAALDQVVEALAEVAAQLADSNGKLDRASREIQAKAREVVEVTRPWAEVGPELLDSTRRVALIAAAGGWLAAVAAIVAAVR